MGYNKKSIENRVFTVFSAFSLVKEKKHNKFKFC